MCVWSFNKICIYIQYISLSEIGVMKEFLMGKVNFWKENNFFSISELINMTYFYVAFRWRKTIVFPTK